MIGNTIGAGDRVNLEYAAVFRLAMVAGLVLGCCWQLLPYLLSIFNVSCGAELYPVYYLHCGASLLYPGL